jgi:hypothetical protein
MPQDEAKNKLLLSAETRVNISITFSSPSLPEPVEKELTGALTVTDVVPLHHTSSSPCPQDVQRELREELQVCAFALVMVS